MFETYVCHRWLIVLMITVNLNSIAILNINGADYCCIIKGICTSDTVNYHKMLT